MARFLRWLFLAVLISTAATAWAGFIRGQVKYVNGEPAARVVVRLHSDVIAYQVETQTDPEGKFNFDSLPLTAYYLTIEGQGFRPYSSRIDISGSRMAYELITLRQDKEPAPKPVPPEGPASVVNAHLAEVPPRALKEFQDGEKRLGKKRDLAGAAHHLRKAVKLYDKFSDAYLLLGMVYLDQQKTDDAQAAVQRSIELSPNSAPAYVVLGSLFNQQGRYSEAEKTLTHALELKPDDAEGHCELARAYLAMGRWQEAETHARKAVAFMPDLAAAHIVLGNVALRKHDQAVALSEYKEYLRLDPQGAMAEPARQAIAQIEAAEPTTKTNHN